MSVNPNPSFNSVTASNINCSNLNVTNTLTINQINNTTAQNLNTLDTTYISQQFSTLNGLITTSNIKSTANETAITNLSNNKLDKTNSTLTNATLTNCKTNMFYIQNGSTIDTTLEMEASQ